MKIKKMRIIKRGQSTRVLFSENGKNWVAAENIWGIVGDYDINIDTEINIELRKDETQTR